MDGHGEYPKRKPIRLPEFEYAVGAYFVTVCTHNKEMLFGGVGADSISARMIERTFLETIAQYPTVEAPIHVIMPNHFHAIITITRVDMESTPTLPQVMQTFKRYSTIEYIKMVKAGILPPFDGHIWQRSCYDHVIRTETDYLEIAQYIQNNPAKWAEDEFYVSHS